MKDVYIFQQFRVNISFGQIVNISFGKGKLGINLWYNKSKLGLSKEIKKYGKQSVQSIFENVPSVAVTQILG